jgi:hypothetical protein
MDESPTIDLFEIIVNVLWWIFWLATAACLSSMVNYDYAGDKVKASCAFAWLTFFLWTGSTVLSIMNTLKGRKSGGAAPAAPAAPAVAMV